MLFHLKTLFYIRFINSIHMRKFLFLIVICVASSCHVLFGQGVCETAKKVAEATSGSFESIKGKYSSADYVGQWSSKIIMPGALSSVIDENSGMFFALMGTRLTRDQAVAMVNKLSSQMACTKDWISWPYDNQGEMIYQIFYCEHSEQMNVDGGNHGGWAEGSAGHNNTKRQYNNYDRVAKGRTICIETLKMDEGEKYDVRFRIYDAK